MVQINFALREVSCKVVYYGPGMSGKTTNLEVIHRRAPEGHRGELTSIATEGDRTLFFDFMPLDLGTIAGMKTKFQLYTVPGQVYYNSTRKLVLQGVDGVVFVADSSPAKMEENLQSYSNLEENLREYGRELRELPHVIQWNKRDLPDALPVAELNQRMNKNRVATFEAVAMTGEGVFPTLKALASAVLENINRMEPKGRSAAAAPAPVAVGAAASSAAAPVAAGVHRPSPSFVPGTAGPMPAAAAAGHAAQAAPAPSGAGPVAAAGGGRFTRFAMPIEGGSPPRESGMGLGAPAASPPMSVAPPPSPPPSPMVRGEGHATGSAPRAGAHPPRAVAPRPGVARPPLARATRPAAPAVQAVRPAAPAPAPAVKAKGGGRSNVVYAAVFGALVTAAAFGVFLLLR
jgi:mutual gliding-motility protein MglA